MGMMGGDAGRRAAFLVGLVSVVVVLAGGCGGGSETTPDQGETAATAPSTSAASGTSISEPAASPRFSDEFTCAYALEPDDGGGAPVLSGPNFCDDPVLRTALGIGHPWFADPGNGRACLAIFAMLESGPSIDVRCDDPPTPAEVGEYCGIMRSLEPEVASSEPDTSVVAARLKQVLDLLGPGDARKWTENLYDLWGRPVRMDNGMTLLNINGFSYAEIICGFSYEQISDPPSEPLPTIPEPTVAPPMEVNDELPAAGSWMAVLASVPIDRYSDAIVMAADWTSQGLNPELIDSRDFDGLNDSYWVLGLAGFTSKAEAQDACAEILGSPAFGFVPDCLVRQL